MSNSNINTFSESYLENISSKAATDTVNKIRKELERQVRLANLAAQRAEIARQLTEKQAQIDLNASGSIDDSSSALSEMLDYNYMISCSSSSLFLVVIMLCVWVLYYFTVSASPSSN